MDPACLVESVPNFSEGRREAVIDEIVAAFAGAHPDVLMLDRSSDPDHDRSVVTLAGPPAALVEAAVAGAAARVGLIDLTPPHAGPPPPRAAPPPPPAGLSRGRVGGRPSPGGRGRRPRVPVRRGAPPAGAGRPAG